MFKASSTFGLTRFIVAGLLLKKNYFRFLKLNCSCSCLYTYVKYSGATSFLRLGASEGDLVADCRELLFADGAKSIRLKGCDEKVCLWVHFPFAELLVVEVSGFEPF